jgi:hypothetical protein
MAIIKVEAPSGELVQFEVAGDKPTNQELRSIQKILNQQDEKKKKELEQSFDRTSGIKNAKLRLALSGAEKDSEKELVLNKFGLNAEDYIQDRLGQFALTPSGASKFGVETDKNVIIDETGFSRYDLVDLAGIVPELGGAVAGGLKGAALGTAVAPGLGTLIGGAIGAGAGAATGSLAEEAVEGLAGVSDQSAKEILKDAGKEAAFAAGGELVFGTPFLLFRALTPKASIIKEGGERLEMAGKAMEMGFQPSKAQLGTGPISQRIESLMEEVLGQSPRLAKNFDALKTKLDEYKSFIDQAKSADNREAGDLFLKMAKKSGAKYRKARKQAMDELQKNISDGANVLGQGLSKNSRVSDDLFKQLNDTFKAFDEVSEQNFANLNNLFESATGSSKILETTAIDELAENMMTRYNLVIDDAGQVVASGFADDQVNAAIFIVQNLKNTGRVGKDGKRKVSFSEIYQQRKALKNMELGIANIELPNGALLKDAIGGSGRLSDYVKQIKQTFDNTLDVENIKPLVDDLVGAKQLSQADADKLILAAEELPGSRKAYAEGINLFNKVESTLGFKSILTSLREGKKPIDFENQILKAIDKNNPKGFENLRKAINNDAEFNKLKQRMGNVWIRHHLKNTGFDSIDPKKFNPNKFIEQVENLGKVGDDLFGVAKYAKVKEFANKFKDLSLKNINDDIVDTAMLNNMDANILSNMQKVLDSSNQIKSVVNSGLIKKLKDLETKRITGDFSPEEAVLLVNSKTTPTSDLVRVMNYFKNDDLATDKIRASFLEDTLDGIGVTRKAKDLDQLSKRLLDMDGKTGGKLNIIFGKEKGENIRDFAKVLKLIASDTPGSGLVGQSIATNFMSNIGKIARIGIVGRLFSSKEALEQVQDAYKVSKGLTPERRAKVMGSVFGSLVRQFSTQNIQEGVNESSRQLSALVKNTPSLAFEQSDDNDNQLSQLQQNISQPNLVSNLGQINVGQPQSNLAASSAIIPNPKTRELVDALKAKR